MKDLLKISILGFMVGVVFLILGYLGVYYISGQEIYEKEILQLTNITTLQQQLAIVGVNGIMLGLAGYYISKVRSTDKKSFVKDFSAGVGGLIVFIITIVLLINAKEFDEVMANMIMIIEAIIMMAYLLINCIKEFLNEFIINKKIKEKNSK